MSPYTKAQIAALEHEKQLRRDWADADKTPKVISPWVQDARADVDTKAHRIAAATWCAIAAYGGIMFLLGWIARAWL